MRTLGDSSSHALVMGSVLAALLFATPACEAPMDKPEETTAAAAAATIPAVATGDDTHSFARPFEARVTHMNIDWTVDFDRHVLDGTVELDLQRMQAELAGELILDSRDLDIRTVEARMDDAWRETSWSYGDADEHLGRAVIIQLPAGSAQVRITYATRPEASGLQWLEPAQTAGGSHPFLYSQAQAIHARSFIPCQDSPAVRVTFKATLRVPAELTAVMAAARAGNDREGTGVFHYEMPLAIPSYLIALAVGDLKFAEVGPRTGVWAEPPLLERSAAEFADMEKMLSATEALYGPYRWLRYDILVLPPSFPFGGMENPMLTFATPTILAGDRSLVALVAHEMALSWSGNLVTNATWSDFWLNEGFTTYIEKRIMEAVYGQERAEMEWVLGRQDLDNEIDDLAETPADQILHIDLSGRDPDDGMTQIAYEKGALFLRLLEETYGRDVFDRFIKKWFDGHAFTSVTTATFRDDLQTHLLDTAAPVAGAKAPDLDLWLTGPGLPTDAPAFASQALARVDEALASWVDGTTSTADLSVADWNYQQWLHFVRALPADLDAGRMAELDSAFNLTGSGNNEILAAWMRQSIRHGYHGVDDRLEQFLTSVGRRKFLEPLYRALMETPEGRVRGQAIYQNARSRYHAIATRTLDKVLEGD
ncbi:MAG: M1 family metallopeptidase [Acidobacteria bacterium]|nr:M1 family metallopeptidase [Acidobacteriota bacterium]